jgi:hypothetical protein
LLKVSKLLYFGILEEHMNKMMWKKFGLLWGLGLVGVAVVMPYAVSLQAEALAEVPIPLPVLILLSLVQSSILVAIVVFFGIKLSTKVGLQTPLIDAYLTGHTVPKDKRVLKVSIASGLLVATVILALELIFTYLMPVLGTLETGPLWQGLLASFYGGITEELIMRYFLMSLVVWALFKLFKTKSPRAMYIAILSTAILFGLLHLPAMAALVDLTPLIIVRTVLLNSIGGVVFGYLYWKHGLEYAMMSHFTADILIQTISRML